MARCGCSNVCSCVVQGDGTTTTVDGNGSSGTPYIVHAIEQGAKAQAVDTPTVDTTVSGAGTAASPFLIGSDVKVSTDQNNCLTFGQDGALFVQCPTDFDVNITGQDGTTVTEPVPNNFVVASPITNPDGTTITRTGTGTTADPFVLHVPATGGDTTGITAIDTNCINTTVVGPDANGDFTIQVDPIIAPEPNGLECTATGLAVPPSADAGNTLVVGGDGRLFVPTPAAGADVNITGQNGTTVTEPTSNNFVVSSPVVVPDGVTITETGTGTSADPFVLHVPASGGAPIAGCGIEVSGQTVSANVQPWPFACDITTNGGGVYCDTTTGELRVDPPHISTGDGNNTLVNYPAGTTVQAAASASATVNEANNDPCRPAVGTVRVRVSFDINVAPGETVTLTGSSAPGGGYNIGLFYSVTNTGTVPMFIHDVIDITNGKGPFPAGFPAVANTYTVNPNSTGPNSTIDLLQIQPAFSVTGI